jgi:sugar/nucleoside kinase (ribokinase family)
VQALFWLIRLQLVCKKYVVASKCVSDATVQHCLPELPVGARSTRGDNSAQEERECRCLPCLHLLDVLKPTCAEVIEIAEAIRKRRGAQAQPRKLLCELVSTSAGLVDATKRKLADVLPSVWEVLREGVGTIVLSMGENGCAVCQLYHALSARTRVSMGFVERSNPAATIIVHHIPAVCVKMVSATGAGDCLVAGLLYGLYTNQSNICEAACWGMAAALLSCKSINTVPLDLSLDLLAPHVADFRRRGVQTLWSIRADG